MVNITQTRLSNIWRCICILDARFCMWCHQSLKNSMYARIDINSHDFVYCCQQATKLWCQADIKEVVFSLKVGLSSISCQPHSYHKKSNKMVSSRQLLFKRRPVYTHCTLLLKLVHLVYRTVNRDFISYYRDFYN